MNLRNSKDWLIVLLFLIAAAVSWNLYFKVYMQADTIDIHGFPRTLNSWVSEELTIGKYELAILETQNAFVRKYTNSNGNSVYVFLVYSQNNRKVSHPPEICYTGSGATVVGSAPDTIILPSGKAEIDINRLIVEKGNAKQLVFYWFKVGENFTRNYWKQQSLIAVKSFLGKPASSALIRLSTDIQDENSISATRLLKEFGELLIPQLQTYLP